MDMFKNDWFKLSFNQQELVAACSSNFVLFFKKAVFFLILLYVPFCVAKNDYMIACIDNYPPYQYIGPPPHGIHIDALKKLAQSLNKKVHFIESPNIARCEKMLKNGQVDVIAGFIITKKRQKFAFYAPYKQLDEHVILSYKSSNIIDYQSLKGKMIGVPRGTHYFKKFDEDNALKKVYIQNISTGIQMLLRKRIDAIIVTSTIDIKSIVGESQENLTMTVLKPEYERDKNSYFGFSKLNKLGLSQSEIIDRTTQAFKQGKFK